MLEVRVAETGETFACAAGESLLQSMMRRGANCIPVGCTQGGCGVCRIRILEGEIALLGPVSRARVSVEDEAPGCTLAWRVAPTTALVVEVLD